MQTCEACNGTGYANLSGEACPVCKGTGLVPAVQTYYAKSIVKDLTAWIIIGMGLLIDPAIQSMLVELGANPALVSKGVIVAGLVARVKSATRPAAFILPSQTKPVEVPKL